MANLIQGVTKVISGQIDEIKRQLNQVRTLLGFGPPKK